MNHMIAQAPPYAAMIEEATRQSTVIKPSRLIVYSDEVTPGNVLSPHNQRKFHAIYFNFLEVRKHIYSEFSWLMAGAILSIEVANIEGGLSGVMKALLESLFVGDTSVRFAGITLDFGGEVGTRRVFIELHAIIADADALRAMFAFKGAAGLKPCFKCRNCVLAGHGVDSDGFHVSHATHQINAFVRETDAGIFRNSDIVRAGCAQAANNAERDAIEKAIGMNDEPAGVLQSHALRPFLRPSSGVRYDPMHCALANGTVSWEVQCFIDVTRAELGQYYGALDE